MQYQGGKSRIAKPISEVINALSRRKVENCEAYFKSDNERSSAREREREREYLSACSAAVAQLKAR